MLFEPQSTQRTQRVRIAKVLHEERLMARMSKLIFALRDPLPLQGSLSDPSTSTNIVFSELSEGSSDPERLDLSSPTGLAEGERARELQSIAGKKNTYL